MCSILASSALAVITLLTARSSYTLPPIGVVVPLNTRTHTPHEFREEA